jgi:hypothetical protein
VTVARDVELLSTHADAFIGVRFSTFKFSAIIAQLFAFHRRNAGRPAPLYWFIEEMYWLAPSSYYRSSLPKPI